MTGSKDIVIKNTDMEALAAEAFKMVNKPHHRKLKKKEFTKFMLGIVAQASSPTTFPALLTAFKIDVLPNVGVPPDLERAALFAAAAHAGIQARSGPPEEPPVEPLEEQPVDDIQTNILADVQTQAETNVHQADNDTGAAKVAADVAAGLGAASRVATQADAPAVEAATGEMSVAELAMGRAASTACTCSCTEGCACTCTCERCLQHVAK
jgi:hypothetical protein